MALDWTLTYPTLMGWNQTVAITPPGGDRQLIKVKDFNIGITQKCEVEGLVTGSTDHITWSKGVIEVGGSISAPLTKSFANTIIRAANDAASSGEYASLMLESTVHGTISSAMVNSCRISAEAGGNIEVTAELFGRLGLPISDGAADPAFAPQSGTTSIEVAITRIGGNVDTNGGADPAGLETEQIPKFDQVKIPNNFMPNTIENMLPTGITFTFENNLQRNYIIGVDDSFSSLDAYSISAGQRKLSGTMSFQSGTSGKLAYVTNAGMSVAEISAGQNLNFANLITVSGENYRPLWSAAPPTLNTQKVVVELEFVLIATTPGFHITIGGND